MEISDKKIGYIIHGSTGCSCCSNDNFIEGLYEDQDSAIDSVISHRKNHTVCSQYSDTGIYTIREIQYEEISDGRIIIEGYVFNDKNFVIEGNLADLMSNHGKVVLREK